MKSKTITQAIPRLTPNQLTLIGVLIFLVFNSLRIDSNQQIDTKANVDVAHEINRLIRTGADGEISKYKPGYISEEYYKAAANKSTASRSQNIDWLERGPGNVAGRTRCILVDAADATKQTLFMGTAGGGIWKSTDQGGFWFNVTPQVPNLAVVTLAQSPANPAIIYAGTGEGGLNGTAGNGSGILKSTDSGDTWSLLESTTTAQTNDFWNTNRIVVDPSDADVVVAVTSNGKYGQSFRSAVMKSTDGGTTWTQIYQPSGRAHQIVADPQDFNTMYVSMFSQGIAKTTDGGVTWRLTSLVDAIGQGSDRTEFAVAPSNPNVLYASVAYRSRGGSGLYWSEDKGDTWLLVKDKTSETDTDWLIQGEFDNSIAIHPTRDDIVYWGGVEIWTATISRGDVVTGAPDFLGADEVDTETFLSFVNFNNGTHFGNRLAIPSGKESTNPTIEVRFGPDKTQKAHRFTVPAGSTSGVPAADYTYADYVDVPFEVWDVTNQRQLMVSFRDQQNDGEFNLNESANDQEEANNREYLYINDYDYDATTPNTSIARAGGHEAKHMVFMWPTLTPGGTWDADNLPESIFRMRFGATTFQNATITNVTSNGGANGGKVHPDHHSFHIITTDDGFNWYTCHDGGMDVTSDQGATFVRKDAGVIAAQFYAATKQPSKKIFIGGTQDNEVLMSINDPAGLSGYSPQRDGTIADGFDVVCSINEGVMLASNQQNVIFKTTDGGQSWSGSVNGLTDAGYSNDAAPFFTKLGHSKNADGFVFAISISGVWRSSNFGKTWSLVDLPNESKWGGFLDVEVSDADPRIVWAGGGMSDTRSLYVSTDVGITFSEVSAFADRPDLGNITTIVPDPNDRNTAFVTLSQAGQPKILKTTDLGQTWTDLSGFGATGEESSNGFPNVAAFCVLPFPDGQKIWAGTEIGLFESLDAGATWQLADNGIPNVMIWDLKVVDGTVIAATHGRGIWSVDLELSYTDQLVLSEEGEDIVSIETYPNPAQDYLTIRSGESRATRLEMIDMHGKAVLQEADFTLAQSRTIDVREFNPGVYILNIQRENGAPIVKKILID